MKNLGGMLDAERSLEKHCEIHVAINQYRAQGEATGWHRLQINLTQGCMPRPETNERLCVLFFYSVNPTGN
jgi:hypothetical protein